MIEFSCNNCGAKFKVSEDKAGKAAKCSKCGLVLHIPVSSDKDDRAVDVSSDSASSQDTGIAPAPPAGVQQHSPSAPKSAVVQKKGRRIRAEVILGIEGAVVLGALFLLLWFFVFRDTWEQDNGYELKRMCESVAALVDDGELEEGIAEYEAIVALVGGRQLEDRDLQMLLQQAKDAADEARREVHRAEAEEHERQAQAEAWEREAEARAEEAERQRLAREEQRRLAKEEERRLVEAAEAEARADAAIATAREAEEVAGKRDRETPVEVWCPKCAGTGRKSQKEIQYEFEAIAATSMATGTYGQVEIDPTCPECKGNGTFTITKDQYEQELSLPQRQAADNFCLTLLANGSITNAAFVSYFSGLDCWRTPPEGLDQIGVRYVFKFTTLAGLARTYDWGYVLLKDINGTWAPVMVNVDGINDIRLR